MKNGEITSVEVFAYKTRSTEPPFDDVKIQIFDDSPMYGAQVIYGDETTNVMSDITDSMIYRIFHASPDEDRKIWNVASEISTTLESGIYWLSWKISPGIAYCPPVTIAGQIEVPDANAITYDEVVGGGWVPLLDGTSGTPLAMPFVITYTVETLGVSEVREFDSRISVYPNPSSDYFSLSIPEDLKGKVESVQLFDMNGRMIKSFGVADSYDVSSLAKGVYLVKINTGSSIKALQFIKK